MRQAAVRAGIPLIVQRVGTMFTPFFTAEAVRDFDEAKRCDREAHARFFHAMLDGGVYLPPSAFEAAFASATHGQAELELFESALGAAWAR
jgi:glutamate-1-semialdehyde 2,1-aminomutase